MKQKYRIVAHACFVNDDYREVHIDRIYEAENIHEAEDMLHNDAEFDDATITIESNWTIRFDKFRSVRELATTLRSITSMLEAHIDSFHEDNIDVNWFKERQKEMAHIRDMLAEELY